MKHLSTKKLHVLVLVTFLFAVVSVNAQVYSWKQKANFGGIARWGAFGFSIDSLGYVGGGYNNGVNLNDYWAYSPTLDVWTQKANVPVSARAASSFVINGLGYVVGGILPTGSMTTSLHEYNPVANSWVAKAVFPGVARYGGAGFAIGGKGYYGIGNGGSAAGPYYTDFFEYDQALNSWTAKASFLGAARYGTYGIALNGLGYVGFGVNESVFPSTYFNDWYEYNPVNNAWTAKTNYPGIVRNYPAGFPLNNEVYMGTGQDAGNPQNDFYSFDPLTNSWSVKPNYSGGNRWLVVGFSIGSKGYFCTGYDFTTYFNDCWEYSIADDTWANSIAIDDGLITVYPTLFTSTIVVKRMDVNGAKVAAIKLCDVTGKVVLTFNSSNAITHVATANLSKGIYFLSVTIGNKVLSYKLVKH